MRCGTEMKITVLILLKIGKKQETHLCSSFPASIHLPSSLDNHISFHILIYVMEFNDYGWH